MRIKLRANTLGRNYFPTRDYNVVTLNSQGRLQLTSRFDSLERKYSSLNTESWLDLGSPTRRTPQDRPLCKPDLIKNATGVYSATTYTPATDWELPTRPPGVDDLITNGASGTRGQMVNVYVTTVSYAVMDSGGQTITDLVIRPTSSELRTTTSTARPAGSYTPSSSSLSTGSKAGIGVGSAVGALAIVGMGYFLFRRRRQRKANPYAEKDEALSSDGAGTYSSSPLKLPSSAEVEGGYPTQAAEAPGDGYPGVEARKYVAPAELPEHEQQTPLELPGDNRLR
jgi:1,3-beta-glucanosyltransferase GAS3